MPARPATTRSDFLRDCLMRLTRRPIVRSSQPSGRIVHPTTAHAAQFFGHPDLVLVPLADAEPPRSAFVHLDEPKRLADSFFTLLHAEALVLHAEALGPEVHPRLCASHDKTRPAR
jgi:hypothetical protein